MLFTLGYVLEHLKATETIFFYFLDKCHCKPCSWKRLWEWKLLWKYKVSLPWYWEHPHNA